MKMHLLVSESMEPVEARTFVVFKPWWRVEANADHMANIIPDNFSSIEFRVEVSKLHV